MHPPLVGWDKERDMTKLDITGMTCNNCVKHVTHALQAVEGVEEVEVNLEAGAAFVTGYANPESLIEAVREEGYGATLDSANDSAQGSPSA